LDSGETTTPQNAELFLVVLKEPSGPRTRPTESIS
jgi:hypothetical protein